MKRKEIVLAIGILAAMVAILTLVYIGTATVADEVKGTRGEVDNSYMDTATYLGSASCTGCHSDKAALWTDSAHTKMLQDPDATTVLPPSWSGAINLTDGGLYGNMTLYEDSGTYYVDLGGGYNHTVWKTMGSAWKQRYVTEIGASKYILPLQWNTATSEWVSYDLSDWFDLPDTPKDMFLTPDRSWDRRCAGCHSTNTTVAYVGTEWVASYTELNIGCEACHGPGSD
ncbi:MAG: cytochrome c family protein, partial [Candidatus Thermoplasmatota archaeon]|nr:cytochrome c family protein [Candidatus Thermoplasmatota archaeon]